MPHNDHVSRAGYDEDEEEDIIRIHMVPLEAAFDEKGDETIQVIGQSVEDSYYKKPSPPRKGILTAEEILAEAADYKAKSNPNT